MATTGSASLELLRGVYAYSYRGSFGSTPVKFQGFAGYILFDGGGGLEGYGQVSIPDNELASPPRPTLKELRFQGTYTVEPTELSPAGCFVYTGTFQATDQSNVTIEYYYVMADEWRELKFMMKSATKGGLPNPPPAVAGTMKFAAPLPPRLEVEPPRDDA